MLVQKNCVRKKNEKKMKIKKNGKVINLTESDLKRIVKKVLNENPAKSIVKSVGKAVGKMGEHYIMDKILEGDISIDIVFAKLNECFPDLPEKCKAKNIVQDPDCQLKMNLDCISTKIND